MRNKRQIISISLSLVIHVVVLIILVRVGVNIGINARNFRDREKGITVVTIPVSLRGTNLGFVNVGEIRGIKSPIEGYKRSNVERFQSLIPGKIKKFPRVSPHAEIASDMKGKEESFVTKGKLKSNERISLPVKKRDLPMPSADKVVKVDIGFQGEKNKTREIRGEKGISTGEVPVISWKGRKRKLKSAYPIRFPKIIKRIGRDVDVEAEIMVAPSGSVVDVRILKSSGYEEVDRIVESALRRYIFSADPEGKNSVGRLKVHFILRPEE